MITRVHSYRGLLSSVVDLIEEARRQAARLVNSVITATYWEMGRRIVEHEQQGRRRAGYGEALLDKLSAGLTAHFGRGFSRRNLEQMRLFYLNWRISQTLSAVSRLCRRASARRRVNWQSLRRCKLTISRPRSSGGVHEVPGSEPGGPTRPVKDLPAPPPSESLVSGKKFARGRGIDAAFR
jgi:hypothetical protein